MKKYLVCLFLSLALNSVFCQDKTKPFVENKIRYRLQNEIINFKANLCPLYKDSTLKDKNGNTKSGYEFLYPGKSSGLKFDFEILQWGSCINYYLVVKKSNSLTGKKAQWDSIHKSWTIYTDSISDNHPCNLFFPFDERYLVYCDSVTNQFYCLSGNVVQNSLRNEFGIDVAYQLNRVWGYQALCITAVQARCAQYCKARPNMTQMSETADYYEVLVTETIFPVEELVFRIQKHTSPETFGNTWEMIYYSNSPEIPNNKDKSFYEVKYIRSVNPTSYEELLPKYKKMTNEEIQDLRHGSRNRIYYRKAIEDVTLGSPR